MKQLTGLFEFKENFVIFDDGESQITAFEFDLLTKRIAVGLENSSLDLNTTILYYLPSRLQFLISWALIRMGVRSGGYNLAAEKLDLGKVTTITPFEEFNRSKHDVLYLSPKVLYEMTQLDENSFQENLHHHAELIFFSSGSSGEPKAMAFGFPQIYERVVASSREVWTDKKPYMSLLGQSSIPGFQKKTWDMADSRAYLAPGRPNLNLKLIQNHEVRALQASPNQLAELLAHARHNNETMPSLELVKIAGGFASEALIKQLDEQVEVWNTYASSEAGQITLKKAYRGDFGNVGEVVTGSALQIVDENNQPMKKGEAGIIRVRRDNMASSYLGSENEAFIDGWFYPGDIGYINPEGELILVGRTNDTENIGGLKLNLNDVDQALSDISMVKEIAGFFYEDANGMRKLGAACVPAKGFDLPELMLEMKWRLGEKTPTLVMQLNALPRSENGKLLREQLSNKARGQD